MSFRSPADWGRSRDSRPRRARGFDDANPGGDAARFVATSLGPAIRQQQATLAIGAPLTELEAVLRWFDHTPIESEKMSCVVTIRAEDVGRLAMTVARIALTAPVEVIEPAELADTVNQLAMNCLGNR